MTEILHKPDNERIVVIGMGGVTPVGGTMAESWEALKRGEHGIKSIEDTHLRDDEVVKQLGAKVVAPAVEVKISDDPLLYEHRSKLRYNWWHRSALLGFMAYYQALKDADLLDTSTLTIDKEKVDEFRAGFYLGSTFSGVDQLGEIAGLSPDRVNFKHLMKYLVARSATAGAMPLDLNGPGGLLGQECASGGGAIRLGGKELLPYWGGPSDADIMVVGGTDAEISRYNMMLFGAGGKAVTTNNDPNSASRPLDQDRSGLVMGEGSAALVLASLSHARALGIRDEMIYAELVGFANYTHAENETRAGEEGMRRVISAVLRQAGVLKHEILYFNGHLTSTNEGDPLETRVSAETFLDMGLSLENIWYNSIKGATGHTMGASGAIEAAMTILALKQNIIPPTLNLYDPIPEALGLNLSPLVATELPSIDVAVSTSYGFGGTAAALAFRNFKG